MNKTIKLLKIPKQMEIGVDVWKVWKNRKVARDIVISRPTKTDVGYSVLLDPKFFVIKKIYSDEVQHSLLNKREAAKIWPLLKKWARRK